MRHTVRIACTLCLRIHKNFKTKMLVKMYNIRECCLVVGHSHIEVRVFSDVDFSIYYGCKASLKLG